MLQMKAFKILECKWSRNLMPFKSIVRNRQERRDKMIFGPIKLNKMGRDKVLKKSSMP